MEPTCERNSWWTASSVRVHRHAAPLAIGSGSGHTRRRWRGGKPEELPLLDDVLSMKLNKVIIKDEDKTKKDPKDK